MDIFDCVCFISICRLPMSSRKRYPGSIDLPEPSSKRMKTTEDSAEKLKNMQATLEAKLKQLDAQIEGPLEAKELKATKGILKKPGHKQKKKRVRFSVECKKVDGDTARRYARPDFLKHDGGYLRPKSKQEIEEEIRKGYLNDTVRPVIVIEEEDSSEDEPYDPNKPNNYENYCRELARKKSREQKIARERAERQLRQKEAENAGRMHTQLLSVELVNSRNQMNTQHIPPAKPKKASSFGKKMLEKMGWKSGEGLGSKGQGVKGCLAPGRNNVPTMVMDSSRILRLQNMVGPGDVDDELRTEVGVECSKFGQVVNVIVHETKKKVAPEHAVNVFVEFLTPEVCEFAIQSFNGRFFGGRRVLAAFFPEERYRTRDLDP